jgi:hypothetical protein
MVSPRSSRLLSGIVIPSTRICAIYPCRAFRRGSFLLIRKSRPFRRTICSPFRRSFLLIEDLIFIIYKQKEGSPSFFDNEDDNTA